MPASGLFPCLPGEQAFRFATMLLLCSKLETHEAYKGISIGVFSRVVDITMRPNVQWLIKRNVKYHVMFFRLIKFKITI